MRSPLIFSASFCIAESEFSERGIGKFCEQGSTGGCNVYKNEPRSKCMATNDIGETARRTDIAFKIIRLQRRYLYEDIENDRFPHRPQAGFK